MLSRSCAPSLAHVHITCQRRLVTINHVHYCGCVITLTSAESAKHVHYMHTTKIRECEFAGVERWNGPLEWSTGLDYWSGRGRMIRIIV